MPGAKASLNSEDIQSRGAQKSAACLESHLSRWESHHAVQDGTQEEWPSPSGVS